MKNFIHSFLSICSVVCLTAIATVTGINHSDAQQTQTRVVLSGLSAGNGTTLGKQDQEVEDLLHYYDKQIYFTQNAGQWPDNVMFKADFPLGQALVTKTGMMVGTYSAADMDARRTWGMRQEKARQNGQQFNEPAVTVKGHGWLMNFVNSSPEMTIEGKGMHADKFNYFGGNFSGSISDVTNYKEIWYRNVYDNVDVRYYPSEQGTLEYDIVAKPGFDKNAIAIRFDGIESMYVNANGHLVLHTQVGDVDFPLPVAYQNVNGKQTPVVAKYIVRGNLLKFDLGRYDASLPLLIDPIALRWATWLNSSSTGANHGHCIWVDPSDGAIYIASRVDGSTNFITTGAFDEAANGGIDLIVGKYTEPATVGGAGTRVWQTYIGGSGDDNPYAMEQGPDGNLYLTGYSASGDYPLIGGTAFTGGGASINNGSQTKDNIFVTKISKDGASIKSAVIGGNGDDGAFDLRITASGDIILCGNTRSTNFPTLFPGKGASATNNGGIDVIVLKINADLSNIAWIKNYGGSGTDQATIMLTNQATGEVFIGGYTQSSNFPTTSPRQSSLVGKQDGFLQKLKADGTTVWSSYFQSAVSTDTTFVLCMEFNTNKNKIYFGGIAYGLNANNITAGSYQTSKKGSADYFVASMDTNQAFTAGTYVGGTAREVNMMGLNVDLNNDVYIFGYSRSTDFPVTADALQSTNMGLNDKNFFKLSSDLKSLKFSTYYGGSSDDYDPVGERGIKFSNCRIYTIVTSESNNIPLTQGAISTSKSSSASIYEPGLVVWANPPDLANNVITSSQIICPGTTPIDLTGSVPSYSLPTIVRNGAASSYSVPAGATTYQWQTSSDSINWSNINGATTQNLPGATVGAIFAKTFVRRIIGGDACVVAGAANQIITIKTITISATVSSNNICAYDKNGTISVSVADGTAPYTYHWSNGASAANLTGLVPGTYTVTVNDNGGCSRIATYVITGNTAIIATASATNTTCGLTNGAAGVSFTGGTTPYSFNWSNGATSQNLTSVAANTYTVTITDALGCTASASSTVLPSAPPVVVVNAATICKGATAALTASGASTYSWTPNTNLNATAGSNVNASPIVTITYTVKGTDVIGCTANATSVVTVNANPTAAISGENTICSYGTASLSSNATAGSGSITTYQWQVGNNNINGATAASYNTANAGTYNVVITNSNGCSVISAGFVLSKASALSVQGVAADAACKSALNGSVNLTVSGSLPGYAYNWNNGASTEDISSIGAGNYSVTVTDSHGCTVAQSFSVNEPTQLAVNGTAVNANCKNELNGSINITANGGSPAYAYSWSNGATTEDLTSISAGSYTVTVTDSHGCSVIKSFSVTEPTLLAVSGSTVNANCKNELNGSINITANGGSPAYAYSWSNGTTTEDLSLIGAGSYTVTVTDSHGCSVIKSFSVTEPTLLAVSGSTVNANCKNELNGSINITANGGTPSYTYNWSNGATTEDLSPIGAGNYSVTVTDSHGCSAVKSFSIAEPTLLAVTGVTANAACNSTPSGAVDITVQGGSPAYGYSWSNGAFTQDINALGAGEYIVTVTDAHNCSIVKIFNISQPSTLAVNGSAVNANCSGDLNGSIDITANGGSPAYTYNWNNGASIQDISGLSADDYSVTVTDANGCNVTKSFHVAEPSKLTISGSASADANCKNEANGSINITINGGSPAYTYSWSNGASTEDIASIGAGNYSVTVTDSHGCQVSQSYTISEPTKLVIDANAVVVANANCKDEANGSINLIVNGGTPSYTYNWSNGTSTEDISSIGAGSYSVTITDAHGCQVSQSYTISEPAKLVIDANAVVVANANCKDEANGSIDITINGGTAPYTYSWTNGASTEDISSIGAGNYSVTITDAHGCQVSQSYTISEPTKLVIDVNAVVVANANCKGEANGSINITVNGGTAPYTYSWTNGASTEDISSIGAGNYSVTITDAHGCQVSQSYTISEPTKLVINASAVVVANANCKDEANGSINITVNGGTAPYTYSWTNGASTEDISSIGAGNYSVTITDAHGCQVSQSYTISEPTKLVINASAVVVANANCKDEANGSINITVNGGTAPYTYSWSNGTKIEDISSIGAGNYSVTITDAHGCQVSQSYTISEPAKLIIDADAVVINNANCKNELNGSINITVNGGTTPYTYSWSNGAKIEDISSIGAGNYSVTITDAHGCQVSQSYTISEPVLLTLSGVTADAACNSAPSGEIDVTVAGGTVAYSYNWNNGASTQDINELNAGDYTLTVTDSHGCSVADTYTVGQPSDLSVNGVAVNANCNSDLNGSIDITANGGSAAYTYNWSNGSHAEDLSGIGANDYTVTVTDAHGCNITKSFHTDEPSKLALDGAATNANCNGELNGSIEITANGGTAPYTYSWSNGSDIEDLSAIAAGNYSVTLTDSHGCSEVKSFEVSEPAKLTLAGVATDANCKNDLNGSIDITIGGGTAPYTYSWNNDAATEDLSSIGAGEYAVTVTDAHGCSIAESFEVKEPLQLEVSGIAADAKCKGDRNGSVNITVNGGSGEYTYNWTSENNAPGTDVQPQDILNVGAGEYSVSITDAHGCTITQSYIVSQPVQLTVDGIASDADCKSNLKGAIDITAAGGSEGYTYNWSNNTQTEDQSGLGANEYTVTVTDAHGCQVSQLYVVSEPTQVTLDGSAINVDCKDGLNGSINIAVNGGTAGYTYLWNTNDTIANLSGIAAGDYTVTVTDAHNCSASKAFAVTEPELLTLTGEATDAACKGNLNGAVNITVAGGTSDYTYNWNNNTSTANISNLAAGTYTVTATDAHGCLVSQSFKVEEPKKLETTVTTTEADCSGKAGGIIDLTVEGGNAGLSFAWSTNDTTEDLSDVAADTYTVTVTDSKGCTVVAEVVVTYPQVSSDAGDNVKIDCASGSVQLQAEGNGTWSVIYGNGSISSNTDPNATLSNVAKNDSVILVWTVVNGVCEANDTITAEACIDTVFFIPTGFSPNGDGVNDHFVIKGIEKYPNNNLTVYNRWGGVVYTKDDYNNEWTGENESNHALPDATYFVTFISNDNGGIKYAGYVDMRRQ